MGVACVRRSGVSTYTLRHRISSGDLPAVKLGYKLIRVRIEDLDKLFPAIPTNRPEDRYRRWWECHARSRSERGVVQLY